MTPAKPILDESPEKKQIDFLKFLNTIILSSILGVLLLLFNTTNKVKSDQVIMSNIVITLTERQNANIKHIEEIEKRVSDLEDVRTEAIKNWVETYFVRKPQAK